MRFPPAILLLLCVAATFNATYDVQGEQVQVTYHFDTQTQLELMLPDDARSLTLDGAPAEGPVLVPSGNHEVSFTTQTVLERTDDTHLLADLSPIEAEIGTVTVLIPTQARLVRGLGELQPSIHPPPTRTSTDGTRLIFSWQGEDLEPARAVLVTYSVPGNQAWIFAFALAVLVAGLIVAIVGRRFGGTATRLTHNLYSDEKRLVETLQENGGELWQKELQEKSGLTKVKVSRKLRGLEAKGVIEKVPYGNTNKIRIKKP